MPKLLFIFFYSLLLVSGSVMAQDTATNLFRHYETSLYQIRIIEKASQNKVSIGSGFQISENGILMSNYHVISQYALHPDKYQIEYEANDGTRAELALLHIDIVNDLALLKHNTQRSDFVTIAEQLPEQGTTIYSLGNPHDLGMIVVPGTYNDIKRNSFYQRIHFTGSVNPGMSGGPVLNEQGQVIGVNVATAGNQMGFLVPLPHVKKLIARQQREFQDDDINATMTEQLTENQDRLIGRLLSDSWTLGPLGNARTVVKSSDFLPCWGSSNSENKEAKFMSAAITCRGNEVIYVNHHFNSGRVEMQFEWSNSSELNPLQFYSRFQTTLGSAGPGNSAGKNDVSNYHCQESLIENQHMMRSKAIFCTRAYKSFAGLYDVFFISGTVDRDNEALLSHFTLAGVTKQNANLFTEKFLEMMAWQ